MSEKPKSGKDITPRQTELVQVVQVVDLDGVEMGVLTDGTAFLTGRGLAAVAGVAPRMVNTWASEFDPDSTKRRDRIIGRLMREQGYSGPVFLRHTHQGRPVNAFPEQVCMAVLEYYAFEAAEDDRRAEALRNYRVLARAGLRAFVYTALGYDPAKQVPNQFASYHQRLLLNPMPAGWFSVFSETAHMVLNAIRNELIVDQHTVPDISVGQIWSRHWTENELDQKFGERKYYDHKYPDDYPQSASDRPSHMYPVEALPAFRRWLDEVYLPEKYPAYLKRKAKANALPASRVELVIAAHIPPSVGNDDDE